MIARPTRVARGQAPEKCRACTDAGSMPETHTLQEHPLPWTDSPRTRHPIVGERHSTGTQGGVVNAWLGDAQRAPGILGAPHRPNNIHMRGTALAFGRRRIRPHVDMRGGISLPRHRSEQASVLLLVTLSEHESQPVSRNVGNSCHSARPTNHFVAKSEDGFTCLDGRTRRILGRLRPCIDHLHGGHWPSERDSSPVTSGQSTFTVFKGRLDGANG